MTPRQDSQSYRTILRWFCQILVLVPVATELALAQSDPGPSPSFLTPGLKLRCDFSGGEVDRYLLALDGNQMLDITVDQRGIDVSSTLKDLDGEVVYTRDSSTGPVGEEHLLWVIEESGRYELEVEAWETEEPPGCYEISFTVTDSPTQVDRQKASAAKALAESLDSNLEKSVAIQKLEAALSLWEALEEPSWQAEALAELGIHYYKDDPERALGYLTRGRMKAVNDPVLLAFTNSRLGNLYRQKLMDLELAREYLIEAMNIWKERFGAHRWQARTAHHLGSVYQLLGEFHEALFYYNQAIPLWRTLRQSRFEASSLQNRGSIYYYLAMMDHAYEDLSRTLAIKESQNLPGQAITLTSISYIHTARGEFENAFRLLDRALRLREGERRGQAVTQVAVGWAHHQAGRPDEALTIYRKALDVFRDLGEKDNEARVLNRIGLVRQGNGENEQALRLFGEALEGFRSIGYIDGEAEVLLNIARSERELGKMEAALMRADEAIDIIEAMRKQPFNARLRAIFFASKQHFFEFKIELLMTLHRQFPSKRYDVEALALSERARARSMLEILSRSGVDLRTGVDQGLLAREEKIRRRMKAKIYLSRERPAMAEETRTEVLQLEQEHDRILARIRESHPFYASITEAEPLSVADLQRKILDTNTVMLEYYLAESKSYLWAVTTETVKSFELDVDPEELEETARQVHQLLPVGRHRKYRVQLEWELARLSDRLLSAVFQDMRGKSRLLAITDGALQYVPFAALPVPGELSTSGWPTRLISKYQIVSLPSASTLAVLRDVVSRDQNQSRSRVPRTAAVLADPVFHSGDERVKGNGGITRSGTESDPGRLEHSQLEAEAIREFLPGSRIATGFEASKELATSDELQNYRYVHFATHGVFDSEFPERSGLIFSLYDSDGHPRDGHLHLPEIYHLGLAADLVVLSACQTALGEEIRGEGLIGLTQGFMYSGAPRVMASLWKVLDESTATLMKLFYERLLEEDLAPAEALRAAQVRFLEQFPEWSEPYHWAGFIIQGDF